MNTRRQLLKAGITLPAGLMLGAAATTAAARPTTLDYSSWIPPTHPLMSDFMIPWGKQIEQATDGRVKIRFLPKPVTNPVGHRDAVRDGVADLAFISLSYYPGYFELLKIPMLPFSGNSAESTSLAAWQMYEKHLSKVRNDDFMVLGVYGHGPGAVFTTKKKVEKIEDFNGLKIRVGGGMAADVAKVLNVNAIVKPAPESYELLSTGVADGVFFPPESVAGFRLESIINYATLFPGGLYSDLHAIIMNKRAFEKLSAADQKTILEHSGSHIAKMGGKAWGDADVEALSILKEKKVEFIQASDQLISDIKERTRSFEQNLFAIAKEHGLDGPAMLADFRSDLKKIEKGG